MASLPFWNHADTRDTEHDVIVCLRNGAGEPIGKPMLFAIVGEPDDDLSLAILNEIEQNEPSLYEEIRQAAEIAPVHMQIGSDHFSLSEEPAPKIHAVPRFAPAFKPA